MSQNCFNIFLETFLIILPLKEIFITSTLKEIEVFCFEVKKKVKIGLANIFNFKYFLIILLIIFVNTVVSNHFNSNHVPSFSCHDV